MSKKPRVACLLGNPSKEPRIEINWNVPVRLDIAVQNAFALPHRREEFVAEAFDHASELAYRTGRYWGQGDTDPIRNIVLDALVFNSRDANDFLASDDYSHESWLTQHKHIDALVSLAQLATHYSRA